MGVCIAANSVPGVRACLIHECYSAHQGVVDDDMNVICLGGHVVGNALASELVRIFLEARFSGAERHRRRLAKVARLEGKTWNPEPHPPARGVVQDTPISCSDYGHKS